MPTKTVWINKVTKWPDHSGRGFHVYVVGTSEGTVTTTDAWRASLCDRAMKQQRPAKITWKDVGRDKRFLQAVELPDGPETADAR